MSLAWAAERCPATLQLPPFPAAWRLASSGLIGLGMGQSQGYGFRKKAG